MDFAVPANYSEKIEEKERGDKFVDLAIELKRIWKVEVAVIPIVIGALIAISKNL